jgi:hypothetical protein
MQITQRDLYVKRIWFMADLEKLAWELTIVRVEGHVSTVVGIWTATIHIPCPTLWLP